MSWVAIGAAAVGAAASMTASEKAADGQAQATNDANNRLDSSQAQLRSSQAQYTNYGARATNKMAEMMGLKGGNGGSRTLEDIYLDLVHNYGYESGSEKHIQDAQAAYDRQFSNPADGPGGSGNGYFLTPFTGKDLQNEPGYQFGLSEGQKGIDRRTAASGNFFSGGALKAASRYGTDYAGTKYGEAFNRDAASKNQMYNFLSGGMSLGQNAAAGVGNAGMAAAGQYGANTTSLANAQGAAGIAGANAWGQGAQNAYGSYQQNELMKQLATPKLSNTSSGWGAGQLNPSAYGFDGSNGAYWN